ncbi:MAG: hypothetical protein ABI594_16605 [Ginsengibacter sp.]
MVVALAGRRIDAEDASSLRFPTENIEKIKEKLGLFFVEKKPEWLVSSGACGADLIALDVAGELEINRKMILPFDAETFKSTSVTDRPGDWGILFDRIYGELKKESNVVDLGYDKDEEDIYEKANFDILNEADKIYSELKNGNSQPGGAKKIAVIIWEGKPKDSGDTTDHFRQEAINRGYEIREINSLH